MGAAQPAAQALLGDCEGLLDDVVGTANDRDRPARRVAGDGMADQALAVAVQKAEHDRLGPVGYVLSGGQPGGDPLA